MRQKGFVQIIVIVLLLVFVGGVAYYFGVKKGNIEPVPTQSTTSDKIDTPISTTSTTKPTTNPTVNWKTYTNSQNKFSFKYPASWDTYPLGESNQVSTLMVAPQEKVDKVKQMQGGFGGGIFLALTISIKTKPPVWETDENWQVTSQPIEIGGVSGTKYNINVIQDMPGLSKGDKTISVVVKNNEKYIQIDLLDQTYKDIFDQILSTFKFLQ